MPDAPLGPAIAAARMEKALSLATLAEPARIKVEILRALEQGSRASRPHTIRAVAKASDVTPEALHRRAAEIDAGQRAAAASVAPPEIDGHRLFRLLAERTRLTANRANVVRGPPIFPTLTLDHDLYVAARSKTKSWACWSTVTTSLISPCWKANPAPANQASYGLSKSVSS
jgi:hypothetical protein